MDSLKKACLNPQPSPASPELDAPFIIKAVKSGIYEGIDQEQMASLCAEHSFEIRVLVTSGTFLLPGTPIMVISRQLPQDLQSQVIELASIPLNQTIQGNYFYGFNQLREIALKALSPGINDPGTAIISLHALSSLILYRANHFPEEIIKNEQGIILMVVPQIGFETLALESTNPIWDYGKDDRLICDELYLICAQLRELTSSTAFDQLLRTVAARRNSF